MPAFRPEPESRVALRCAWPADSTQHAAGLALLRAAGLEVNVTPEGLAAAAGAPSGSPMLDFSEFPEYLPLALALAAALAGRGVPATLAPFDPTTEACQTGTELIDRLDFETQVEGGRAVVQAAAERLEREGLAPWPSPGPTWSMIYALAALARPGDALANPGSLSELLPWFWSLYNRLPGPVRDLGPKPTQETNDDGKQTRRRIRIP